VSSISGEDWTAFVDILQQLTAGGEQIAAGYSSRERFLTELTLDPPDATSDQAGETLLNEDYLILSTISSANDQQVKSVFMLNAVDGCILSDLGTGTTAEIEEEPRLLHVSMTRAKDNLHCRPAPRLHPRAERAGRPPHLRRTHAVYSGELVGTFRVRDMATRVGCGRPAAGYQKRARRLRQDGRHVAMIG
jgi:hypothetical protein